MHLVLCLQGGIDENVCVAFWQEVATVKHVRSTIDLPIVIAGGCMALVL